MGNVLLLGGPMSDSTIISQIFTQTVRDKWRKRRLNPKVLEIIEGESDPAGHFASVCAVWSHYLLTANAHGFLDDDKRERLTSGKEEQFRGALGECLAFWYFAAVLNFPVHCEGTSRPGKNVDFSVTIGGQNVSVEVKSPVMEFPPPLVPVNYNDSAAIAKFMKSANEQLSDAVPNILVICPDFPRPLFHFRHTLINAALGESQITFPVNIETGEAGPFDTEFFTNGMLMKHGPSKRGFGPQFTRISAVMSIEESVANHNALLLHNPNTINRLPPADWKSVVQLEPTDGNLTWSDGEVSPA